MRVWLASYPRSGNSLLGQVLARSFGIVRASIYSGGANRHDAALAGDNRNHAIQITKTHKAPENDDPVIYIVRDGRSAVVSYKHFMRDNENRDVAIRDLILGRIGNPLNWSAHFQAWQPRTRPKTLMLRYEEVVADKTDTVEKISDFLGIPPVATFDVDFAAVHAERPTLIRRGSDAANISELEGDDLKLFDETHGPLMRELVYYKKTGIYSDYTEYS